MKYLTWIIAFTIVAIVNTIFKELDIAHSLAVLLSPNNIDEMAIFAGLFSGIFAATTYGYAYYFARKINKRRETVKKQKNTDAVGTIHKENTEALLVAEEPAQAIPAVPTEESVIAHKAAQASPKQRYCKLCGGVIDNQSKKCTKCHKQYFRITRNGIIIFCLCFLNLMLVNEIVYQDIHYEREPWRLHNQITELEKALESKNFAEWSNEKKTKELQKQVDFYNEHVVFVSDNETYKYHHLGCEDFDPSLYSFWAFNVEQAEDIGLSPCSKCCK